MTTPTKVCKDCQADPMILVPSNRPAPFPGPRCATHDRIKRRADRLRAHGRRLESVYGIDSATYAAILEQQGGTCAICQRATGKTKRLAVDHDHVQARLDGHDEDKGCRACVRGLLCGPCNDVLGHFRSDPKAGTRLTLYLIDPPARRVLHNATEKEIR